MDFSNVNIGDRVYVHHEGFQSHEGTVVKKFKNHFRVAEKLNCYDFYFDGKPKTKTFIPLSVSY